MKLVKFFALIAASASMFVGCEPTPQEEPASADAKLSVVKNVLEVNTPIEFIVEDVDGNDVTAESVIFDAITFDEVSNPLTITADGKYKFYAVYGDAISNYVDVVVTPTVPELPEDAKPENTEFKHRILLVDHTGNECGYCPRMMTALKEVAETGDYHSKYYEAIAHTYKQTDPASSSAAFAVSGHFNINDYPTLTYNFYHPTSSSYNAEHIKGQINALWKENADAGIAASTNLAAKSVVVNAEVKAAVAGEYSVTAWLLEDGIEARQTNATESWMNIHNNAIRQTPSTSAISGYEVGALEAGKTATQIINLKITRDSWNRDNMKVMVIVSKKNDKGKYDVANVAICPINDSITYDYK